MNKPVSEAVIFDAIGGILADVKREMGLRVDELAGELQKSREDSRLDRTELLAALERVQKDITAAATAEDFVQLDDAVRDIRVTFETIAAAQSDVDTALTQQNERAATLAAQLGTFSDRLQGLDEIHRLQMDTHADDVERVEAAVSDLDGAVAALQSELTEQRNGLLEAFERRVEDWTTEQSMERAEQRVRDIQDFTQRVSDTEALIVRLHEAMAQVKDGEPGEAGEPGPQGNPGPQGEPGPAGQDRPLVSPAPIHAGHHYGKNTVGRWGNGLWISTRKAIGDPSEDASAWHCVLDGWTTLKVERGNDREFTLRLRMGSGEELSDTFQIPFFDFKGVYLKDATYQPYDIVTKGSALWMARQVTDHAPPGNGWEQILTAQRGQRGHPGAQGDPGQDGRSISAVLVDKEHELLVVEYSTGEPDICELPVVQRRFVDGRSHALDIYAFRGRFDGDEVYERGDVVSWQNTLLICAVGGQYLTPYSDPEAFEKMIGVPAGGGVAGASTGAGGIVKLPQPTGPLGNMLTAYNYSPTAGQTWVDARGQYRVVPDAAAMNAIPATDKANGTLVFTQDTQDFHWWDANAGAWQDLFGSTQSHFTTFPTAQARLAAAGGTFNVGDPVLQMDTRDIWVYTQNGVHTGTNADWTKASGGLHFHTVPNAAGLANIQAPAEGDFAWQTDFNVLHIWDSNQWQAVGSGANVTIVQNAAGLNAIANARDGDLAFKADDNSLRIRVGGGWQPVGSRITFEPNAMARTGIAGTAMRGDMVFQEDNNSLWMYTQSGGATGTDADWHQISQSGFMHMASDATLPAPPPSDDTLIFVAASQRDNGFPALYHWNSNLPPTGAWENVVANANLDGGLY